jgi:hypothetical protein
LASKEPLFVAPSNIVKHNEAWFRALHLHGFLSVCPRLTREEHRI